MDTAQPLIGRFTQQEVEDDVANGLSFVCTFDWPPARAWLEYRGPAALHGSTTLLLANRPTLVLRLPPDTTSSVKHHATIPLTRQPARPGWNRLRTAPGWSGVPADDRATLEHCLRAIGRGLRRSRRRPQLLTEIHHVTTEGTPAAEPWLALLTADDLLRALHEATR